MTAFDVRVLSYYDTLIYIKCNPADIKAPRQQVTTYSQKWLSHATSLGTAQAKVVGGRLNFVHPPKARCGHSVACGSFKNLVNCCRPFARSFWGQSFRTSLVWGVCWKPAEQWTNDGAFCRRAEREAAAARRPSRRPASPPTRSPTGRPTSRPHTGNYTSRPNYMISSRTRWHYPTN